MANKQTNNIIRKETIKILDKKVESALKETDAKLKRLKEISESK